MNVNIICVGKIKEQFYRDAVSEYEKRLSRFAKVKIIEVRDEKIPENASEKENLQVIEKEGLGIAEKLPKNSMLIAMCIEGKESSSTELAKVIENAAMEYGDITFIIGGSLGLSEEIKKKCAVRMSFGKITLPHQLMRVVLLEQIYRGFKINANESYHK